MYALFNGDVNFSQSIRYSLKYPVFKRQTPTYPRQFLNTLKYCIVSNSLEKYYTSCQWNEIKSFICQMQML